MENGKIVDRFPCSSILYQPTLDSPPDVNILSAIHYSRPTKLAKRKAATDTVILKCDERNVESLEAIQLLDAYLEIYAHDCAYSPALGRDTRSTSLVVSSPSSDIGSWCAFDGFNSEGSHIASADSPSKPVASVEGVTVIETAKNENVDRIDWARKCHARKILRALDVTEAEESEVTDPCVNIAHPIQEREAKHAEESQQRPQNADTTVKTERHFDLRRVSASEISSEMAIADTDENSQCAKECRLKKRALSMEQMPPPRFKGKAAKGFRSFKYLLSTAVFSRPETFPSVFDGRERRRRARDAREHHSSSDASSPLYNSPMSAVGSPALSPLAMAGMMIAAGELDRLTNQAKSNASSEVPPETASPDSSVPTSSASLAIYGGTPSPPMTCNSPYYPSMSPNTPAVPSLFSGNSSPPPGVGSPGRSFTPSPGVDSVLSSHSRRLPRRRSTRSRLSEMYKPDDDDATPLDTAPTEGSQLPKVLQEKASGSGRVTSPKSLPGTLPSQSSPGGAGTSQGNDAAQPSRRLMEWSRRRSSIVASMQAQQQGEPALQSGIKTTIPSRSQSRQVSKQAQGSSPESTPVSADSDHNGESTTYASKNPRIKLGSALTSLTSGFRRKNKTGGKESNTSASTVDGAAPPVPDLISVPELTSLPVPAPPLEDLQGKTSLGIVDHVPCESSVGRIIEDIHDAGEGRLRILRRNTTGTIQVMELTSEEESGERRSTDASASRDKVMDKPSRRGPRQEQTRQSSHLR
jgi:hypothetical protein